uniref:Large ribosomal subunit protein eL8 n=1 Tax=Echinococcus canadensis TaxID=519352 RepID=A0A915EY33_9CEST
MEVLVHHLGFSTYKLDRVTESDVLVRVIGASQKQALTGSEPRGGGGGSGWVQSPWGSDSAVQSLGRLCFRLTGSRLSCLSTAIGALVEKLAMPVTQKKVIKAKKIKEVKTQDVPLLPEKGVKGKGRSKIAALPDIAKKSAAPEVKKPTKKNPLIQKRPKNFGIGQAIQPRRNVYRFVKWPKYIELQRKKAILKKRLKVPPPINQFSHALDRSTSLQIFNLCNKYRPLTKQAKKAQLTHRAQKRAGGAPDAPQERRPCFRSGVREVTASVMGKKAQLVLIAHDVDPIEIVLFLPALCRKMGVPYAIIKGKARLGRLVHRKTCTCLAFTTVKAEDKPRLAKIVQTVKTNFNDRYDEIRKHWGGGIMGSKSLARVAKLERAKAKELKLKMG